MDEATVGRPDDDAVVLYSLNTEARTPT